MSTQKENIHEIHNSFIKDATVFYDLNNKIYIYHIKSPHALNQVTGYVKFMSYKKYNELVFFRGENKLYGSLVPSLFRNQSEIMDENLIKINSTAIDNFIKQIKSEIPSRNNKKYREMRGVFDLKNNYIEATIQHYGIKTRYIDVVDNIWIALWFACHNCRNEDNNMLYQQRECSSERDDYAFILLCGVDSFSDSNDSIGENNGKISECITGKCTELIDLRIAVPSCILRPHAQHGLSFRKIQDSIYDYKDQIRAVIQINLDDALSWLGDSKTLNAEALFPSKFYDEGYRILLGTKIDTEISAKIGSIALVGP